MIFFFLLAAIKPLAGLAAAYALDGGLLEPNAGGIPAWPTALVSAWCAAYACECYWHGWRQRKRVGRLLGWLWMLASASWASRCLRDTLWPLPAWWVEPWWSLVALLVPVVVLIGWSYGGRWRSPLAALVRGRRELHTAGCCLTLAILAVPLAFHQVAPLAGAVAALIYGSQLVGSWTSARLMRVR